MEKSFDEITNDVLTENTAQTVFKYLQDQESNRLRMHARWIWELLQNARDASSGNTNLIASIECKSGELVFKHNGRGFTQREIAHLIFHGSTKTEEDTSIGKFGSGFLTTHLLSSEINVSGRLDDGRSFDFPLSRAAVSVEDLRKSMKESRDRFLSSITSSTESLSDNITTQFRYPINGDAVDVVEAGIATLKLCAPLVVVFNLEFSSIHVESSDEASKFEALSRSPLNQEALYEITVEVRENGTRREQKYLLAEGEGVSVALPMGLVGYSRECLTLDNIPRLFLGFPLIGTENFSFPAVINSMKFTPTENRDGVYLGQSENKSNVKNQRVIEEACELQAKLVQFVAESGWRNIYTLANIPPIPESNWLNEEWIRGCLKQFVEQTRQTPAVLCGRGPITPKDCILPYSEEGAGVESLWDLLSEVEEYRLRLPERDEAIGWCRAFKSWAAVVHQEVTSFNEVIDGYRLASNVEEYSKSDDVEYGTLNNLQDLLCDDVCAVQWLNRLHGYLLDNGFDDVVRDRYIVLDQDGNLDILGELHRDNEIDEELIEIADDLLGLRIRQKLRDNRLKTLADLVGKGDLANKDVVQNLTDGLEKFADDNNLNDEFSQASARLLAWIVGRQEWGYLSDYPAYSSTDDDNRSVILRLTRSPGDESEIPLAPVKAWPEDLQPFSELFPWRRILSDTFFQAVSDPDAWRMLDEQGLVRKKVIVTSNEKRGDFLPDEPLPEIEGVHRTCDAVPTTNIVYFAKDDTGIMERVRHSQNLARVFWRFLTEFLVKHDPEGLNVREAPCECDETHRYFQAEWLAPLAGRKWVPLGGRKTDRATASSLAILLRDSGWKPDSLSENPATIKLLEAIRVSRFDLMREFIVEDEESRAALDVDLVDILASTGGDLSHVREFLVDMESDRDLPDYLARRREQRRIVHENHELGRRIEDLVKKSLEGVDFNVERTGIGSDFEIEYDLIEEGHEIGFEMWLNNRTWLVEVKATRDQSVLMTVTQARTAVEKGDGFLLCVVPVRGDSTGMEEDDIRDNMRFVRNIGPHVKPLCEKLNTIEDMQHNITQRNTDIQLELRSGTARFRVHESVWLDGIRLKDLAERLK